MPALPSLSASLKADLALAFGPGLRVLKRRPLRFWGLGLLSSLPLDLLLGWKSFSNPAQLLLQAAYTPVYLACQVVLLGWLGPDLIPGLRPSQGPLKSTLRTVGSQLMLAFLVLPWCVAGALPGLALMALANLKTLPGLLACAALLLAGLVPAFAYFYRRGLAPALVVWEGAGARQSLLASRDRVAGRDFTFLRVFLVFGVLSNLADVLPGLAQPGAGLSTGFVAACLACRPLSLWLDTVWMALLYRRLGGFSEEA